MGGRRQPGTHVVFRVGPVAPVLTIALERDRLLLKLPGAIHVAGATGHLDAAEGMGPDGGTGVATKARLSTAVLR